MCRNLSVLVLVASMFVAGTAFAQSQAQNRERCLDDNPDIQIAGCTALIELNQETGRNLATTFNNRGNAYAGKQDYDRAIQDFDQVIRLDPNNAIAFGNRGIVYLIKQDYDRAIQDFDQAIRLDPNYAAAIHNRDIAYERR